MTEKLHILRDENQQQKLMKWYRWIHDQNQRGNRARLCRCSTVDEVLMQPGFHRLCKPFPNLETYSLQGLALVAGLLVWVEKESEISLSKLLGKSKTGTDKSPIFSELRFQRLLTAKDSEDFFQDMRRAIIQVGKTAEPLLLADSILHWYQQQKKPDWYQGRQQWHYQFARPYYQQII